MKTFDKKAAAVVHDEMVKALADLGKKLGVEFTRAGGKFDLTEMTLKIKVVPADKEVALAEQKKDFASHCKWYGLDASDYLRVYDFRGEKYEIIGFNLNKPKYCVQGKRADGVTYSFPHKQIVKQFHPERIGKDGEVVLNFEKVAA